MPRPRRDYLDAAARRLIERCVAGAVVAVHLLLLSWLLRGC